MDRFWSKVAIGDWQECWPWTGATGGRRPYGRFRAGPVTRQAHHVAYELLVGPIPEGLQLDHVRAWGCVTTLCCNPLHLEPVTPTENIRRGGNAMKTHCKRGHEFTPENTYTYTDSVGRPHRFCRACTTNRIAV
jgi:hypothetical protein